MPTRRPSNADKTLRSPTQLAMARGTTKPDSKKHVVVSVQVRKSGDIWPFCVQAQAAEDVLEWLQPSGRRPEGCCCSTELSGGRGRLPEATGYRHRRTMHVPCMPRLTLADVCGRQPDSHQSFDPTSRNAAGRCSTSASMCGTRETQRGQRSGDGEGRDCSPPRTAAVCSDKHSGHSGAMPAATVGQSRWSAACS